MRLDLRPLSYRLGAGVRDIDIPEALREPRFGELHRAFLTEDPLPAVALDYPDVGQPNGTIPAPETGVGASNRQSALELLPALPTIRVGRYSLVEIETQLAGCFVHFFQRFAQPWLVLFRPTAGAGVRCFLILRTT